MNDFEVVKEKLAQEGVVNYSLYQANGCVGVTIGRISCYYYVLNGKVIDIIFD